MNFLEAVLIGLVLSSIIFYGKTNSKISFDLYEYGTGTAQYENNRKINHQENIVYISGNLWYSKNGKCYRFNGEKLTEEMAK